MKPSALIGACVAGLVGALVWGAIAHFSGYEVGYIAWGIGLIVGGGALVFGGGEGGAPTGVMCAVVAALSIIAGKYMAFSWTVSSALDEGVREVYDEHVADATALTGVDLADDDAVRHFIATRGYSEKKTARNVTDEELAHFKVETAPFLRQVNDENMTFEEWKESDYGSGVVEFVNAFAGARASFGDTFGGFDILWMLLGVGTAFKVGAGGGTRSDTA